MEICRVLAGYSYGRADLVRRAMSKKKHDVMEMERQIFIHGDGSGIAGAKANGVPEETANRIFDEIAGFASYAFNKSHAAAYSFLAYQTAYLKYHYFPDYMAALMTSVIGDSPKLLSYINLCEAKGVRILPPHVNDSGLYFQRSGENIRFCLLAVRNLGKALIEKIIAERERGGSFTGLRDFCKRMSGSDLNKRALEGLICCGAFDGLGLNRHQMLVHYESMLAAQRETAMEQLDGQLNLFGTGTEAGIFEAPIPSMQELPQEELLRMEKEFAGMYLSGHPLWRYRTAGVLLHTVNFADISDEPQDYPDGTVISSICIVRSVKRHVTKKGDIMCFLTCEDTAGEMDCVIFPQLYAAVKSKLPEDRILYITGKLSHKEESVSLLCDSIIDEQELKQKLQYSRLCCKLAAWEREKMQQVTALVQAYPGKTALCFYLTDLKKMVAPKSQAGAELSEEFLAKLRAILGESMFGLV